MQNLHLSAYEDGTDRVCPKRRRIKFRRRGIPHKKAYGIYCVLVRVLSRTVSLTAGGNSRVSVHKYDRGGINTHKGVGRGARLHLPGKRNFFKYADVFCHMISKVFFLRDLRCSLGQPPKSGNDGYIGV